MQSKDALFTRDNLWMALCHDSEIVQIFFGVIFTSSGSTQYYWLDILGIRKLVTLMPSL